MNASKRATTATAVAKTPSPAAKRAAARDAQHAAYHIDLNALPLVLQTASGRRLAKRAVRRRWTLDNVTEKDLANIADYNTALQCALLDASWDAICAKRGVPVGAPKAPRRVVLAEDSVAAYLVGQGRAQQQSSNAVAVVAAPRRARLLVDDVALAVRIDSLQPGQLVKTPDSPAEHIAGTRATIVRIGEHSVVVRLGGARHVAIKHDDGTTTEFESESSRAITWGASTLVVPIDTNDVPTRSLAELDAIVLGDMTRAEQQIVTDAAVAQLQRELTASDASRVVVRSSQRRSASSQQQRSQRTSPVESIAF